MRAWPCTESRAKAESFPKYSPACSPTPVAAPLIGTKEWERIRQTSPPAAGLDSFPDVSTVAYREQGTDREVALAHLRIPRLPREPGDVAVPKGRQDWSPGPTAASQESTLTVHGLHSPFRLEPRAKRHAARLHQTDVGYIGR